VDLITVIFGASPIFPPVVEVVVVDADDVPDEVFVVVVLGGWLLI